MSFRIRVLLTLFYEYCKNFKWSDLIENQLAIIFIGENKNNMMPNFFIAKQNQMTFGIHAFSKELVEFQYSTSLYSTIAFDIINSNSLLCYFEIHHFTWHVTYIPACKFYTSSQFSILTYTDKILVLESVKNIKLRRSILSSESNFLKGLTKLAILQYYKRPGLFCHLVKNQAWF